MAKLKLFLDIALLCLGLGTLISLSLSTNVLITVSNCQNSYSAPNCGFYLAQSLILLLLGVQGVLSPLGGYFFKTSYLVGAGVGAVGIIMQIVFMLALRLDSNYKELL